MARATDDAASFLGTYMARGILASDPFVSIDREGVGELVRIGVERGRKTKAKLKSALAISQNGSPQAQADRVAGRTRLQHHRKGQKPCPAAGYFFARTASTGAFIFGLRIAPSIRHFMDERRCRR
jgi:hypothetical protein